MNRPDEEREAAPKWIESKQSVSAANLGNAANNFSEALAR